MSEVGSTNNDADAAALRAAEQARLRKERREAKIRAGGSARLNKITGMGGRPSLDNVTDGPPAGTPSASPGAAAPKPTSSSDDPEEVDISQHYYAPNPTLRNPAPTTAAPPQQPSMSDDQLRQMMLGLDRGTLPGQTNPETAAFDEDPLMKMMQQMMGGAGGPGGMPAFPGMPSMPGMPQPQAQQGAPRPDTYTSLWRLLHAVVALGLGLYIAVLTPFRGTKLERELTALSTVAEDENEQRRQLFFWVFATAEAVLLTTRFFLDKSRAPPSGMIWTVIGFVPEPFRGYISVAMRYGQIFSTVRADILACMFVLGVCSWWRSEA